MTTASDHARVMAPPPLLALAALLVGAGLRRIWAVPLWAWSHAAVLAGGCFAVSLVLAAAGAWEIWRAKTTILPHHATTALVVSGPFRVTRNPLYLSLGLLLVGAAFAANSLAMALVIVPWVAVMRHGVIAREERYLEDKFGEEYRAYRRRVRRWL